MAEDASGLKIPLGEAVAVVAFLALANVIDFRVSHAALVVGPAAAAGLLAGPRGVDVGFPVTGERTGQADGD
jgi:hypothetical protein